MVGRLTPSAGLGSRSARPQRTWFAFIALHINVTPRAYRCPRSRPLMVLVCRFRFAGSSLLALSGCHTAFPRTVPRLDIAVCSAPRTLPVYLVARFAASSSLCSRIILVLYGSHAALYNWTVRSTFRAFACVRRSLDPSAVASGRARGYLGCHVLRGFTLWTQVGLALPSRLDINISYTLAVPRLVGLVCLPVCNAVARALLRPRLDLALPSPHAPRRPCPHASRCGLSSASRAHIVVCRPPCARACLSRCRLPLWFAPPDHCPLCVEHASNLRCSRVCLPLYPIPHPRLFYRYLPRWFVSARFGVAALTFTTAAPTITCPLSCYRVEQTPCVLPLTLPVPERFPLGFAAALPTPSHTRCLREHSLPSPR